MAIDIIQTQIARFLASDAPEVISIKGAWGVGKTYAWNAWLSAAKKNNKIALERYSYVSLFGLNSLDELKYAIFENMIESRRIGTRPSVATFKSNSAELLKSLSKRALPLLPTSNTLEHYRSMIDSLAFLSLEKTLVCIDDFERKGRGIEAQDILGLITQLKEQKHCKIVLILNDESLSESASQDYFKLREKVVDSELRFSPSSQDCVGIALGSGSVGELLRRYVVALNISNIRIIKKIERLANLLVPVLKPFDDLIMDRALKSLTLLAWCYYGSADDAPDYSFVVARLSAFGDFDDDLALTTQQQEWCALLRHYDNYSVDDFDLQIASLVESGYLNEQLMREEAARLQDRMQADKSEQSFQDAWGAYYDSFDDNAQEVIDCLSASFRHNARYISPVNLDGSVRLLRHLGKDKMATKIIDLYIDKRSDEYELFNLESSHLPGQIRDAEIIRKFKARNESLRAQKTLEEICEQLLGDEDGLEEGELLLAQAGVQEFVDLFKQLKGAQLSRSVDMCMSFGRLGGTTEDQKQISDKATQALKIIGRESKLNASRVRRFGIQV